jgi:hypothetical protein
MVRAAETVKMIKELEATRLAFNHFLAAVRFLCVV